MPDHASARKTPGQERVGTLAGRRIAIFSGYFDSHGGGMELATAELVALLRGEGARVVWVSMADAVVRSHSDDLALHGTDIVYALSGVPLPLPAPWSLVDMWRSVREAELVISIDVNFLFSAFGFAFARLIRKPTLIVQHVGQPSTVSRLARFAIAVSERFVVRPAVRRADAVIAVSPIVSDYLAAYRSEVQTIGHALDLDVFRPANNAAEKSDIRRGIFGERFVRDRPWATYVGRLTQSKGVGVILPLARQRPDWMFLVAGSGPVDINEWGQDNVVALGQLGRQDVARIYRASDVVIQPSQSESFSLVVREALASGARVVGSPQLLETDSGLTPYLSLAKVDLADVDGTAARFAAELDVPKTWSDAEVRNYLRKVCGRDATTGRYLTLIDSLLGRRKGGDA